MDEPKKRMPVTEATQEAFELIEALAKRIRALEDAARRAYISHMKLAATVANAFAVANKRVLDDCDYIDVIKEGDNDKTE